MRKIISFSFIKRRLRTDTAVSNYLTGSHRKHQSLLTGAVIKSQSVDTSPKWDITVINIRKKIAGRVVKH